MRIFALCLLVVGCGTQTTDLVPLPASSTDALAACGGAPAACVDDHGCCAGSMPPLHCKPDAPGSALKHCQPDPMKPACHAAGESCAMPTDCCAPMMCMPGDAGSTCAPGP